MHRIIPKLLPEPLAREVAVVAGASPFRSGDHTAGSANRPLKRNLELPDLSSIPGDLTAQVVRSIRTNALLQSFAMPRRSSALLFNRFDPGMYYDDHVDSPTNLAGTQVIRADLSLTIFLSDPATYDGGELVIDSDGSPTAIKARPGDAVVYSTGVLHRVNPVTRGTRLAIVSWLESLVSDHGERQILFDLARARDVLTSRGEGKVDREALQLVDKCIVNLTRKWMR